MNQMISTAGQMRFFNSWITPTPLSSSDTPITWCMPRKKIKMFQTSWTENPYTRWTLSNPLTRKCCYQQSETVPNPIATQLYRKSDLQSTVTLRTVYAHPGKLHKTLWVQPHFCLKRPLDGQYFCTMLLCNNIDVAPRRSILLQNNIA